MQEKKLTGEQKKEFKYPELQAAAFVICYASKKYGDPGFVTAARTSHCQQKFNWTAVYKE